MESGFSPCKILLFWQRATNPTCICLKFTLFPPSVMVVWGEVTGAISTRSYQNQVAGRVCTAIQPCFWCVLAFLGVGRHIGFNTALLEERRWHRSCQTLTDPEPCRLCLTSVLKRECSSRPPPSLRHQVFGGRRETTFKRLQDPPWPYWERTSGEELRLQCGFPLLACPAALEIGQLCPFNSGISSFGTGHRGGSCKFCLENSDVLV